MPKENYKRVRVQSMMSPEGGAKQSDRETSNINTIIANYNATGILGRVNAQTPLYGDFSQPQDLQTQMHRTMDAQSAFDALPASIRKAASNDPVKFLEMTQDDDGLELLTDLGLVMVEDLRQAGENAPSEPENPAPDSPPATPDTTPHGGE